MRVLALFAAMLAVLLAPVSALAQAPAERGLLITPPRQYLDADPGKITKSSITIANLTESEMMVALSVQQFSVADYTYDYHFESPKENWVALETSQVLLKKTESRTIAYEINVPEAAAPGGHYFTVFASMTPKDGKIVQAATVVYVAVNGELVKTAQVEKNTVPLIWLGGDISYKMDIRNTGNTHFLTYLSGKLNGLSAQPPGSEVGHLLMPQTVRAVEGVISPPLLPGVYQAEYGFKLEDGRPVTFYQYIFYAPPWSWALAAGLIWLIVLLFNRRRVKRATDS